MRRKQHDNQGGFNGFGRIGRSSTRLALERTDLEVVAVNDITDAGTLAQLLAFDSTYGGLGRTVEHTPDSIIIGGVLIVVLSERDPAAIDWGKLGADVVVELDLEVPQPRRRGAAPEGRRPQGADLGAGQGRRRHHRARGQRRRLRPGAP